MRKYDQIPFPMPNDMNWKFGVKPIETDPFGSYTGIPKEFDEALVQDVDDL